MGPSQNTDGDRNAEPPPPHDREARPTPTPPPDGSPPAPEQWQEFTAGRLPGLLDFEVVEIGTGLVRARMPLTPEHLAPNGRLHAATVVALADTACGIGARLALPDGAAGFATVDLTTSYLGTAREGWVHAVATLAHGGRRTQVWDAVVSDDKERTIALFRCTQLIV